MNPFSGVAGSSLEIWSQVKNLFSVASIDIVETITTHQGHAEEVCRTLDLNEAKDGIVVVSGDGLFHEVVNGLLHRDDWDEASKIPLGIIPAGSGNGLARSIQTWNPFLAALAIIKGNTEPLDTWSVITNNDRRFAVLSIEWGTVASIDFDSEAVRFMGGARFHLWSFLKLVNRQRYSAELSWLPGEEDPSTAPKLRELQSRMQQEHILRVIEATNNKYTEHEREGETTASSPAIVENNGEPSLPESDLPAVDDEVAPIPSSSNDPGVVEEKVNTTPRGSLITPPESAAEIDLKNIPGPPLRHLVDRASSDEWKTVNGDWMLILGLNTTHMAHNVHAAPRASISDGLIDMLTISKSSRRILLRMIMAMESGQHIQDPDVGYCKAKAFILKPSFKDDKHMLHGIDGEKVICDGLMVEVHPRMLNVFCDTDALAHAALKNPYSLLSKELQKLNTQLIEEMKREVDNMPEDKLSPRAHASPPSSSKINLSRKDSANPSSPKKGAWLAVELIVQFLSLIWTLICARFVVNRKTWLLRGTRYLGLDWNYDQYQTSNQKMAKHSNLLLLAFLSPPIFAHFIDCMDTMYLFTENKCTLSFLNWTLEILKIRLYRL